MLRFLSIRAESVRICAPLQKEDFVVQPVMDVSPPKWHLAHTTWFFETFLLVPYSQGYKLFDSQYPYLFNSYYVAAGPRWQRTQRGNLTRPTVDEVFNYRAYVDRHIQNWLESTQLTPEQSYILELGINHEQQHQELLYYDIKYIFGHNPIFPTYSSHKPESFPPKKEWLKVNEGIYEIGHVGDVFHFDNEEGNHKVFLHEFTVSGTLVSNREFLDFIEAGGYRESKFWLSEGWDWVQQHQAIAPLYWINEHGNWFYYTLNGYQEVDPDKPVSHVSYFEAEAYARWRGLRLPTEQEWEVAAKIYEPIIPPQGNFSDVSQNEPVFKGGYDFHGNLWEWTASAYLPYPYYEAPDGALGEYNGKFMINQMVLRGGSCATPRDHIRTTYRNFFHPHLRWMFSGIRLAKS